MADSVIAELLEQRGLLFRIALLGVVRVYAESEERVRLRTRRFSGDRWGQQDGAQKQAQS
jgi:hypothetical protein